MSRVQLCPHIDRILLSDATGFFRIHLPEGAFVAETLRGKESISIFEPGGAVIGSFVRRFDDDHGYIVELVTGTFENCKLRDLHVCLQKYRSIASSE